MKDLLNVKRKGVVVVAILCLIFSNVTAQDGEKLFRENCKACHKIDDNNIGPKLKGVKAKWEEAGEGELIYEWIADPTGLYNSGKSQLAKETWEFSPNVMPPAAGLSKKEVDAIFEFIEGGLAPPLTEETESTERNLSMTVLSIILLIIALLIITVWITSNAKKALLKKRQSDF